MNPKVDFYFDKAGKWREELNKLRLIALSCGLNEELKWGCPCYLFPDGLAGRSSSKGNVVLIHDFKEYCAFLFFKGALMDDPAKILIQQTENVQSASQVRFTDIEEINSQESVLKAYIQEAMKIEMSGAKVQLKPTAAYTIPDEFQQRLDESAILKNAFEALTPGRQRAYILHFSAPKQSKTRLERVEKCVPQILNGKGLLDK